MSESNGFYATPCGLKIKHPRFGQVVEFVNVKMCALALERLNSCRVTHNGWSHDKVQREINRVFRAVPCPNSTCAGSRGAGHDCKRPSEHVKWGGEICAARRDAFDEWLLNEEEGA